MSQFYDTLVVLVLVVHLGWILWVIFGVFWTQKRPWLTAFHVGSLIWGIAVETCPWPCPLTSAEQLFQTKAGIAPYRGSFLIHYLDRIVYPNVSVLLLTVCGVAVCGINLFIYARRWQLATKGKTRT